MLHSLNNDFIDPSFIDSIKRASDLERLRTGRHIIRDKRGWKTSSITIRGLWIVEIKPTFRDRGCLAMIHTDHGRNAYFCIPQESNVLLIGPFRVDWPDPIEEVLQHFDLWSARNEISIDGIAYSFFVDTGDVQVAASFINPRTTALVSLERAFLRVATALSTNDSTNVIKEYLQGWVPYVYSGPAF